MSQQLPVLNKPQLKSWLQKKVNRTDKLLFILSSFDEPCSIGQMKSKSYEAGFRIPNNWNLSDILSRSDGKALRTPSGWELSESGNLYLTQMGLLNNNVPAMRIAVDLRKATQSLKDEQTRSFVEEAIKCHEAGIYRAAIILSWLAAVDILQKYVHSNHLNEFNKEAHRIMGANWKTAKSTDDIGKMKEADFLDRLVSLSIIGKNVKTDLKVCLDRRNGCGHPNTFSVSTNQSAAHLETLLLNIFQKFG